MGDEFGADFWRWYEEWFQQMLYADLRRNFLPREAARLPFWMAGPDGVYLDAHSDPPSVLPGKW